MEAICTRGDTACEVYALAAALHSLHLYCACISIGLITCCARPPAEWYGRYWRGQNLRGIASVIVAIIWCCGAAAAMLRPADTVHLASAVMAPFAWLAATVLHVTLWTHRSTSPILYLAIYWLLSAISASSVLWQHLGNGASYNHLDLYLHGLSMLLSIIISAVDCLCFYDEVTKRVQDRQKSTQGLNNISYKHNECHFFSKISFFWLTSLLYKGYNTPLESDDLRELPHDEQSNKYYQKFKTIYHDLSKSESNNSTSLLRCYIRMVWPNFYLAGVMKLISDLIGIIPPLGLAIIIQFIENPIQVDEFNKHVTLQEFVNNGYVMLFIVTLALIIQGLLSQNSTHLVTIEGTRVKTALQSIVYDKCMRLASWSSIDYQTEEESPLLPNIEETTTKYGVLTNLVSQDTYNVMSCVWICHYTWAIPLKIAVILYLLYIKLGISALIGVATSVLFITPLQFYIGKKLADNSKHISKCTDHRISKMSEILHGMNVIKLYVWEDLFKEKILNLREVELKLLNKDSIYWSFLTFTTQVSTVLLTIITFTVYHVLEKSEDFTAINVFTGLALFNQITIPLLIFPVTVLMVIQAMVSTKRIKDFLELPESNNVFETNKKSNCNKFNDAFVDKVPEDDDLTKREATDQDESECIESIDHFSVNETTCTSKLQQNYIVSFRNSLFSWGMENEPLLEMGDLDIPAGKLIMVVGNTGAGKTSLLAAILGEMYLARGEIDWNGEQSTWYAGQPPWLLEGSVRDNIVMDNPWCQRKYANVLRATGLKPDFQLLPEGDATHLGSHGTPLSGGQRVRVCVARALYSNARLLALDEPLAALDAHLARHVVARGLVPAARAGRTVILATNRLELLHYADLVLAMENGRITGYGRALSDRGLSQWWQLAEEARATVARVGVGPPGGTARERSLLVRTLSRSRFQRTTSDDNKIEINETTGAHLFTEVPTCAGGSWRRATVCRRPALNRQFSSPPPSMHNNKLARDVRRAVSADPSNTTLRREARLLRRLLQATPTRTVSRWTPRTIRRLISSDSNIAPDENVHNGSAPEESTQESTYTSKRSNGIDTLNGLADSRLLEDKEQTERVSELTVWREYAGACGWWGVAYCVSAAAAQGLALAADCWLAHITADNDQQSSNNEQVWNNVHIYTLWCVGGVGTAGLAQAASACAGAAARRSLHERLLHATLHASLHHHNLTPTGSTLHRFAADILVIDKKLPTAVSRWSQLALLCGAAILVNIVLAPWTILALLPAFLLYLGLQNIYLCNARELQREEARTAARVVSLAAETCAGGMTVRAGRLQQRMRNNFLSRLDSNHNALLLLNAANRWLGITLDLVGAASVCVTIGVALCNGNSGAVTGLAGAYSLLLPTYLAHLAKCRADLDFQLAAVERIITDINVPQEDYREDCPVPSGWQSIGKIDFENVNVQHEPNTPPILSNINLCISPGQKIAICGRSGSGKSTLLLTCAGATTVKSGRVLIDGQDTMHVPLRSLRHRVVVLPQEATLFSGTLRENLDPLAVHTDEEIWQSLRAVGLFDFINAQPAGLECTVSRSGRGGWSVSRGSRAGAARAALRAGARRAAALLLDEPAAALDAPAERALLAALAAAAPQATIITAAHRISSVRNYDRAIVLDEGKVIEQGEVNQLLSQPTSRLARMLATAGSHK